MAAEHRGLVYASVSGFGRTGAYAGMGAYDVVIQAMSGMMSVTGTDHGELVKAGVPVADFVSGLYAALGVVAWLPLARLSGTSVHLDVPMLDCLLATSALQTSEYWGTGVEPAPRGTRHPATRRTRSSPRRTHRSSSPPAPTSCGPVCRVVEDPDLAADPQFAGRRGVERQLELELLNERFAERPAAEWVALLREAGVPAGPVNTWADPGGPGPACQRPGAADGGARRGTVVDHRLPGACHRRGALARRPAPRLGEQTDEVLAEASHDDRSCARRRHAAAGAGPARASQRAGRGHRRAAPRRARPRRAGGRAPGGPAGPRPHLCGGLDLSGLENETDATLLHRLVRIQLLLERLQDSSAVTVALVHGPAVGAGADLVLAADVRLATPAASLRFPGSGFGAVLGTGRLAAETSPSFALEAATTGRTIDAAEAAARGVWRLVGSPAEAETETTASRGPREGTVAGLRRAASPTGHADALGHLVRSLASTPGLRDRIRDHRDRDGGAR